jgi:ATP-dependent Clp protease ATP-binding subunit ClpA
MLNPELRSPLAERFEAGLRARVVGQDRAIRAVTSAYQIFQAGLSNPTRPLAVLLFLGPTGSGKTRLVEAAAEVLFGDPSAIVKIDCAEFQHSHEIAKLVGSPPGYLGHRETPPLLTQENLARFQTEENPFTLVLFDEIEKASDALWQLLLGILDKATLTLGDNRRVDFSQTMIFLTSNLGAREMNELISGSMGFAPPAGSGITCGDLDQKIYRAALEAARRRFSPEFMNRIDKVVVFRNLGSEELKRVLDLELKAVERRIEESCLGEFSFKLTDQARKFLLKEGTDLRYGARHLKRQIERFLVYPFANLLATGQVKAGDSVLVDINSEGDGFVFFREDSLSMAACSTSAEAADNSRLAA